MTAAPNPFDITFQTLNDPVDSIRVRLTGEFDGGAVPAFDTIATRVVDLDVQTVVVDIENVTLLDSAGIGALMRLRSSVQERNATFTLHAPQSFQQRLFAITGLAHVVEPTEPLVDEQIDE